MDGLEDLAKASFVAPGPEPIDHIPDELQILDLVYGPSQVAKLAGTEQGGRWEKLWL